MKTFKVILFSAIFFVAMSFQLNAQSTCDTVPDPGQTVGKCMIVRDKGGDLASCNPINDGEICFYGEPVIGG
jgi:hypothetical protein